MKKLIVIGPHDSGKTSWGYIYRGLISIDQIETLAREKIFGLQGISDETLIIIVDEFSESPIPSDMLKELFEGTNHLLPLYISALLYNTQEIVLYVFFNNTNTL